MKKFLLILILGLFSFSLFAGYPAGTTEEQCRGTHKLIDHGWMSQDRGCVGSGSGGLHSFQYHHIEGIHGIRCRFCLLWHYQQAECYVKELPTNYYFAEIFDAFHCSCCKGCEPCFECDSICKICDGKNHALTSCPLGCGGQYFECTSVHHICIPPDCPNGDGCKPCKWCGFCLQHTSAPGSHGDVECSTCHTIYGDCQDHGCSCPYEPNCTPCENCNVCVFHKGGNHSEITCPVVGCGKRYFECSTTAHECVPLNCPNGKDCKKCDGCKVCLFHNPGNGSHAKVQCPDCEKYYYECQEAHYCACPNDPECVRCNPCGAFCLKHNSEAHRKVQCLKCEVFYNACKEHKCACPNGNDCKPCGNCGKCITDDPGDHAEHTCSTSFCGVTYWGCSSPPHKCVPPACPNAEDCELCDGCDTICSEHDGEDHTLTTCRICPASYYRCENHVCGCPFADGCKPCSICPTKCAKHDGKVHDPVTICTESPGGGKGCGRKKAPCVIHVCKSSSCPDGGGCSKCPHCQSCSAHDGKNHNSAYCLKCEKNYFVCKGHNCYSTDPDDSTDPKPDDPPIDHNDPNHKCEIRFPNVPSWDSLVNKLSFKSSVSGSGGLPSMTYNMEFMGSSFDIGFDFNTGIFQSAFMPVLRILRLLGNFIMSIMFILGIYKFLNK